MFEIGYCLAGAFTFTVFLVGIFIMSGEIAALLGAITVVAAAVVFIVGFVKNIYGLGKRDTSETLLASVPAVLALGGIITVIVSCFVG